MIELLLITPMIVTLAAGAVLFARELRLKDERMDAERKAWELERQNLLNRIQIPELAAVPPEFGPGPGDGPAYISPEDDAGFERLQQQRQAS